MRILAMVATFTLIAGFGQPTQAVTSPVAPVGDAPSRAAATRSHDPMVRALDTRRNDAPVTATARTARARARLAASLGTLGVLDVDPRSGTPRSIAALDGFLTEASDAPAPRVAMGYVRSHLEVFGMDPGDLDTLVLARDYTDILGTRHLVWQQRLSGIPVFDNDLRAAVTARGRLAWIGGAPLHVDGAPAVAPRVVPAAAAAVVRASVDADAGSPGAPARTAGGPMRSTTFARGDSAHLVWFGSAAGPRLGWQVEAPVAPTERYLAIVDALSGDLLWRSNQVRFDDVEGQGLAWGYYPSDLMPAAGGTQQPVTFPVADGTALSGNNAHVMKWPLRRPSEIPANGDGPSWIFPAVLDTTTTTGLHCSTHWACTWDSRVPWSWRTNMRMASTQLYWYLNTFHDHLEAAPIGFTEAAGNFQLVNASGEGLGGDPLMGFSEVDAGTDHGLPGWAWNAFFSGGPDGENAGVFMLMFPANYQNHIAPSSDSAIDASIVYHEYTHGLSARLLFYADGSAALNSFDAYAMGEAWSDWYAMDLLESQGFITDTPAAGEIVTGGFIQGGRAQPVRSEPMDCAVGSTDPVCPGGETGHTGGYTLGDIGTVSGYPEPHADGEIWSQTLWDLRTAIGVERTEMVVTRAMELSPPDPSFLEMRSSILLADRIAYHSEDRDEIWQVFAARGMGYFATEGARIEDTVEDFSQPPICPDACGKLHGTVTDAETGAPLAGVRVELPGAERFTATTNGTGAYEFRNVPVHTYPGLLGSLPRYEPELTPEVAVTGDTAFDVEMHRDWAARLAGGSVVSASGRPLTPAYNAAHAIDLSLNHEWLATYHRRRGHSVDLVIDLGRPIDVTGFAVAPLLFGRRGNILRFVIHTRSFHGSWRTAAIQEDPLPAGRLSDVAAMPGSDHVRFVRYRAFLPRRAWLVGLMELSVRGVPSA